MTVVPVPVNPMNKRQIDGAVMGRAFLVGCIPAAVAIVVMTLLMFMAGGKKIVNVPVADLDASIAQLGAPKYTDVSSDQLGFGPGGKCAIWQTAETGITVRCK